MFGTEAARSTATIALAPMTLDLIERGGTGFEQAFSGQAPIQPTRQRFPGQTLGGGGDFPMSMRGAIEASRLVDEATGFRRGRGRIRTLFETVFRRRGGGASPDRVVLQAELMRREAELIARWVRARLGDQPPVAINETVIKEMIINLVEEYYRLNPNPTPSGAATPVSAGG
jgi:hypothetical protein